jgi:hypothetical protein
VVACGGVKAVLPLLRGGQVDGSGSSGGSGKGAGATVNKHTVREMKVCLLTTTVFILLQLCICIDVVFFSRAGLLDLSGCVVYLFM